MVVDRIFSTCKSGQAEPKLEEANVTDNGTQKTGILASTISLERTVPSTINENTNGQQSPPVKEKQLSWTAKAWIGSIGAIGVLLASGTGIGALFGVAEAGFISGASIALGFVVFPMTLLAIARAVLSALEGTSPLNNSSWDDVSSGSPSVLYTPSFPDPSIMHEWRVQEWREAALAENNRRVEAQEREAIRQNLEAERAKWA